MLTTSADQDRQRRVDEQVLPEAVAPALHREPAELVGEHVLEDDDVDEDRDRQPDRADDHHRAVGQRAAHVGDGERQADRDDRLDDEQRDQHGERRAEPRRQDVRDRLVRAPRRAEVRGEDLLDEDAELHVVRLVDAELAADVVDLLLVADLAREHVRRVAADPVEQDEHEQHDAEQRRNHLPQSSDDVRGHRRSPSADSDNLRRPDPVSVKTAGNAQCGCPAGDCYSSSTTTSRHRGPARVRRTAPLFSPRTALPYCGTTLLLLILDRPGSIIHCVGDARSRYCQCECRIGCLR